jgi:hypothetical protein
MTSHVAHRGFGMMSRHRTMTDRENLIHTLIGLAITGFAIWKTLTGK